MKLAETVTFGGSGLERDALHRGSPETLGRLRRDPDARAVVLWRGKVLMSQFGRGGLVRLPLTHAALQDDVSPILPDPILLGREDAGPVFAVDLSAWEPEGQDLSGLGGFIDRSLQHHPALPEDQVFAELRTLMTVLDPRDAELAATAKAISGWHATHGFCAKCGAASEIAQGGWQRTCPSCGAHHFPRTDPVVIMLITHGNSVLMGRSPGWPEGMFSLLAGFVEPGETLEAAVRREVFEEAGIRVGAVDYLASQPWPFPSSLMMGCRGEALDRSITIDPAEIEEALWVSREDMLRAFSGDHPHIKPARKGAIAHFLLQHWLADTLD
ncbi:MAG: NAD(+) diphosphatase [Marinibacterium sp.]|nr:NAD(+) diphosphatase [Marinibacterium sp.]